MIDVWPINAATDGGCDECAHDEDRADDVAAFKIGTFKLKLCRAHRLQLEAALSRHRERERSEYPLTPR